MAFRVLAVREIEHGSESGVGRVVELHTKGWLPYTLHWSFRVTESRRPFGFSLEAWGDFEGTASGLSRRTGASSTSLRLENSREKPLLRYLSFLLKPMFSANHRWAMARGEESLVAELGRRAGAGQQSARQTS